MLENRETGQVNLHRLRLAARLGPPNWAIEQRYIRALADLNFPDRAIIELKTCIAAAPYRAESWQSGEWLRNGIGGSRQHCLNGHGRRDLGLSATAVDEQKE